MTRLHVRHAATLLAVLGVGLAMGAPFILGAHAVLAGLRSVSLQIFAVLAASAALSAAAKAGKLHLMQTALGLKLRFVRTFTLTVVTDFAFLVSPLGAAGYGVNMGLLQRAGASWALATTVVGADQALDLTFFAAAVPISFLLALGPLTQVTPNFPLPAIVGTLAGLAILAGVLWLCRRPAAAALDAARQCGARLRRAPHCLAAGATGTLEQVSPKRGPAMGAVADRTALAPRRPARVDHLAMAASLLRAVVHPA
jgi:hypothetical protein